MLKAYSVPGPIARISPARFPLLRTCPLHAAWLCGGQPPLLPQHPAAILGHITHTLMEEAGKGRWQAPRRDLIEARWEELAREAERKMSESWLTRHLVPLRDAIADYEVRRLRAISAAHALACSHPEAAVIAGDQSKGYGYELRVRSRDGLIAGTIDAVIPSAAGPVIRDYKSGIIREVGGEPGRQDLRGDYVLQLKLYAVLYAETFGCWPARLELVPVSGHPIEVPFDPRECWQLASEARATLQRVNEIITRAGNNLETVILLADPSPLACGACLYRPSCPAYWKATRDLPSGAWPTDVRGQLKTFKYLLNGRLLAEVETSTGGIARVRGIDPRPWRHPALERLYPGGGVCLFNLRREGAGLQFSEAMMTVIYAGCLSF